MPVRSHPVALQPRKPAGMALLAVLWLVAALSVMVSGLLHVVRSETRIAAQVRLGVVNSGLADAAIRLVLQELSAAPNKSTNTIQTTTISVFGKDVQVEVIPLNGYIDLNNASENLLSDVFEFGAGMAGGQARSMAAAAVQARSTKGADGTLVGFHSVEDLLQLPGFQYSAYAKINKLLTVDLFGSGRVNPLAAPMGTLLILAKGDQTRAQQLFESQRANPETMDTTQLTAAHLDKASSGQFVLHASVAIADQLSFVRSWRVDLSSSAFGLPWRVLGMDAGMVLDTRPTS